DRVHRCVARILGPRDPDVEDVVQQVFLAALDGARSFDGRSRVSTWIVGIATRRALDAARSRWRRRRWAKITEWVGVARPEAPPDPHLYALAARESAVAAVPRKTRTVSGLHSLECAGSSENYKRTGAASST